MGTIVSFSIRDADGDVKAVPCILAGDANLTDINTFVTGFAPMLNAAIGGVIESATALLNVTLPGGLRTTPIIGLEAQRGALLSFSVEDSDYRNSIFIPTWANAGFAGNEVDNTGVYNTVVAGLLSSWGAISPTKVGDKYDNKNLAYLKGVKKFRK
jgi:hypothetical protein